MYTVGFDISAIDPKFREHAQRGIGRYVRELKRGFEEHNKSNNLTIEYFEHESFIPRSLIDCLPFGRVTIEQQLLFPFKLWWEGGKRFDVLHFPAHMDAPSWCKLPYIITVLDLIPLVCADLYRADRPDWRFKLARSLEIKAIKNAALILTISENTAVDCERILKIPRSKIRVTPLGVDTKFFSEPDSFSDTDLKNKFSIPDQRPIILYVGGIDQRKNYPSLLKTTKALVERCKTLGRPQPVLVMAGRIEQDLQYPKLLSQIQSLQLQNDVVLCGYVSESELLQLYSIATVFLFLSLYEGFGLPVLEAMACGTPIVAGNNSAIPEVVGDTGQLVDVENINEICQAVEKIMLNPMQAKINAEKAKEKAKSFTWQRTTDLTLEAYREYAEISKKSGVVNAS